MKDKLTTRTVNALKPHDKLYKVWDTEIKGFFVRVLPTGGKTYCLFYRQDGQGRDYTIGKHGTITADIARDIAKKRMGEIADGKDIQENKKERVRQKDLARYETLGPFIQHKYKPWAESHLKAYQEPLRALNKDFAHLHGRKLSDITKWDMQKWSTEATKRSQKPLKPSSINRRIGILKSLLKRAEEWGVIESSPIAGLKKQKIDDIGKVRFLNEAEEKRLRVALLERQEKQRVDRLQYNKWLAQRDREALPELTEHFTDYLMPIVLLAINTGMRRGEIFSLKWSNVNFSGRLLTVEGGNAKSGMTRHIPLNDEAFAALNAWHNQSDSTDLVFPSPVTGERLENIRKSWAKLMAMSKVDSFRFHDLRHHFASKLVMAGIDLNTVRELLGHSSIDMTLRYAHLAPEHRAAAVAVLNKN